MMETEDCRGRNKVLACSTQLTSRPLSMSTATSHAAPGQAQAVCRRVRPVCGPKRGLDQWIDLAFLIGSRYVYPRSVFLNDMLQLERRYLIPEISQKQRHASGNWEDRTMSVVWTSAPAPISAVIAPLLPSSLKCLTTARCSAVNPHCEKTQERGRAGASKGIRPVSLFQKCSIYAYTPLTGPESGSTERA